VTAVVVGVHVHAEPARLLRTLESLEHGGGPSFEVVVLPDAPDAETRLALEGLAGVPQLGTDDAKGSAACFNRLVRSRAAEVAVLLESGALVGPGWLELLLAGLDARSDNGIAGPSTNLAWNDQATFPRSDGSVAGIAATAAEALERFGAETRTLEPLHSLADFCYAVRRPVVEAIGGADEGYGLGPCWEMEYSIRAARAGFRAVWVCAAYVHRSPFTPRRRRDEARFFERSKRRYQDSVCGLRLRGASGPYEPHCRGDACEHFAPAELMSIRRPLEQVSPPATQVRVTPIPSHGLPLASCIMPTGNRRDFALQAIRYFQRQEYPARELIVVDSGDDGLDASLPGDPAIRYIRAPAAEPIGAKRNRACSAATGELIVHWDDDDWFAPNRLRRQLEPILAGRADVTALRTDVIFDLESWRFWRLTPELHRRLFVEDVHGGTLAYRRSVWASNNYRPASLAEDAWFLWKAVRSGARLERLANEGSFVYLRHGGNAWRFECGRYLDKAGWVAGEEPPFPADDRAFYAARSPASPGPSVPLVSCVMPTADRRAYAAHAVRYFLRQDHSNRELIVVDDGADRVDDLIPGDGRITYVGLERPLVLGAKRNHACSLARGDVIVHWDDDDWTAPHRLRYQLAELDRTGAEVCGLARQLYLDPAARTAWLYDYPRDRRTWVAGNTLSFRREVWERNPFAEVAVGEDTRFVWNRSVGSILPLADHRFVVGFIHDRNASRKNTADPYWHAAPLAEVEQILGDDARHYLSP
jgi:glycosyltransferase involved in cell wall biosynthesis